EAARLPHTHRRTGVGPSARDDVRRRIAPAKRKRGPGNGGALTLGGKAPVDWCPALRSSPKLDAIRALVESFIPADEDGRHRATEAQRISPAPRDGESLVRRRVNRRRKIRASELHLDIRIAIGNANTTHSMQRVASAESLPNLGAD